MNIPEGYQLKVSSWEGDADHRAEKMIYGLTITEVCFYLSFLENFRCGKGKFGNSDVTNEELISAFEKSAERFPEAGKMILEKYECEKICEDLIFDLAEELLGISSHYGKMRVFDGARVLYCPCETKDVTHEFM